MSKVNTSGVAVPGVKNSGIRINNRAMNEKVFFIRLLRLIYSHNNISCLPRCFKQKIVFTYLFAQAIDLWGGEMV